MNNKNINKKEVLLSFYDKAFLLKCQRLVIQNNRLQDRVGELEENAELDKLEIAQNLQDYNEIFQQLEEQKLINEQLRKRPTLLSKATNY